MVFIQKKRNDKLLALKLSGAIDESTNFSSVSINDIEELSIDVGTIDSINSRGVREWTKWARSLPSTLKVKILNCPQIIIEQINMVAGFLPNKTEIESVYVPYFCHSCNTYGAVLMFPKDFVNQRFPEGVQPTCENCGAQAEWDIIASNYFKFLSP